MTRARAGARAEWVQGHLAEATRLATLLTAAAGRGPRVAEESLAATRVAPRWRSEAGVADAVLAQLVRRSLAEAMSAELSDDDHLTALARLPRRERAALVLRHYADLSGDRVAVLLGCSPRAVAALEARAVAALPAEARLDVREWLDSVPAPRYLQAAERSAILRRSFRRRAARAAAVVALVGLGAVGGLRLPAMLRAPEAPDAADRLRDIRREIDRREAALPFDPDDAGPGTSHPFRVVDGVVGGTLWNVVGYRDASGAPCLQLVVGYDFGARHCIADRKPPIVAVVDEDERHEATFISGMVAPRVASLHFVGPGVSWMDVAIAHEAPKDPEPQPGFFGIALPDRLLSLESREAGRRLGYSVLRGRLTALDPSGKLVARSDLLFAQRR